MNVVKCEGYYNGNPYVIYDYENDSTFSIYDGILEVIKEIENPIDKLVYMFIDSFSGGNSEIYVFVNIGIEQIADRLGLDIFDVEASVNRLAFIGKIKILERKGFANSYATFEERS